MCGIAGFSLAPGVDINAKDLAAGLLVGCPKCKGIIERGTDATGVAWWGNKALCYDKAPISADKYVFSKRGLPFSASSRTVILHTRLATQGSPSRNRNNHPIVVGLPGDRLMGVHNGIIWNDDDLFRNHIAATRYAEVDSEAVFAYLWESGYALGTEDSADMTKVFGSYALAYLVESEPGYLYLARGGDSPLCIAYHDHGVVFASTVSALEAVQELFPGGYSKADPYGAESKNTGVFSYSEGYAGVLHNGREVEYREFEYSPAGYRKFWGSSLGKEQAKWERWEWCNTCFEEHTPCGEPMSQLACMAGAEEERWRTDGSALSGSMTTAVTAPSIYTEEMLVPAEVTRAFLERRRKGDRDGPAYFYSVKRHKDNDWWTHVYEDGSIIKSMSPNPPLFNNVHPVTALPAKVD